MNSLLQEKSFETKPFATTNRVQNLHFYGGSLASKGNCCASVFPYLGVDFTIFHIFLHHLSWKKPSGDGYPYDRPSKNDRTLENGTPDANGCGLGMSCWPCECSPPTH